MAGGVAHNFNNLLMVVLGNLELMRMDVPPEDDLHRHIDAAEKAAQRAANLSTLMLTYVGQETECIRIDPLIHASPSVGHDFQFDADYAEKIEHGPCIGRDSFQWEDFMVITTGTLSNGKNRAAILIAAPRHFKELIL